MEQDLLYYWYAYIDMYDNYFLAKLFQSMKRTKKVFIVCFVLFNLQHIEYYSLRNNHNHTIRNMNSLQNSMHTVIDINMLVSMV